ncbi:PR domain zinc finger protein 5-like [Tubulanus polymorphus]|uniref:PR domain zinc finger protein 5-like n=1 Tax=Tubulanus polymorphus TaxID=672921 RepID=UPI003DA1CFF3
MHICQICNGSFATKQTLQRHQVGHEGKKGFKCLTCGRAFARKDALKRHARKCGNKEPGRQEPAVPICEDREPQQEQAVPSQQQPSTSTAATCFSCMKCNASFHRILDWKRHTNFCRKGDESATKRGNIDEEPAVEQRTKRHRAANDDDSEERTFGNVKVTRVCSRGSKKWGLSTDVYKAEIVDCPAADEETDPSQDADSPEINLRDIHEQLYDAIGNVINGMLSFVEATNGDRIRLSIEHPNLDNNINLPLVPVEELSPELIFEEIVKVMQSNDKIDF